MRARRASLALIAAVLILAACGAELPSLTDAPSPVPARSHSGHFIELPREAASPAVDAGGGAVLTVRTNLPAGTLAYITSDIPGQSEQIFLLHKVVGGTLKLRQPGNCYPDSGIDRSRGFNIQVIVVPDISLIFKGDKAACSSLAQCGAGPLQPQSVQDVLGRNFERLTGDEVTSFLGTPALVASAHYSWPKEACRTPLGYERGFPQNCPPVTASLNADENGANFEAVANSISVLLGQNRICALYNFMTEEFRAANPWPPFRDRVKKWTKEHAAYAIACAYPNKKGAETVGVLRSPKLLATFCNVFGKVIVHARFVATAGRLGETLWKIEGLRLQ